MNLLNKKYIKSLFGSAIVAMIISLFTSCRNDEVIPAPSNGDLDLTDKICIPLTISLDFDPHTRAEDGYTDGDALEHYIDFEDATQCYGIFFKDNKFLAIETLYRDEIIGSDGQVEDTDDTPYEYKESVVAYFKKDGILPNQVLVVLNGGLLRSNLVEEGEKLKNSLSDNNDVQKFLDFTWNFNDYQGVNVIGINRKGVYTMSNSSYLDENGTLHTLAVLDPNKFIVPTIENFKKSEPAGTVYVERMVAKFSAPDFGKDVIGSDKVFRPSQNALSMIFYGWDKNNNLISEEKKWRVHLLGWTINGREKGNYLFKKIPTEKKDYNGWNFEEWNDPQRKRSYWSEDPHYNDDDSFYPWQYRTAVDKNDISLLAGKDEHGKDILYENAALRYFSFNDIGKYWNDYALTISENTFDPEKYIYTDIDNYDSRASLLIGPHLLVTAEIYIESKEATDEDYLGQFHTESHIYSDRLRRFYLSEKDWFKMFLRDFNRALETQENMSFTLYDWDNTDTQEGLRYTVRPSGSCRLFINRSDLGKEFEDVELTYDLLDKLVEMNVPISIPANAKDGDGRLIPWIDGLVIKNANGERVPIYDETDTFVPYEHEYRNEMRKSLFFEWFGPVDHYLNGYMYYAGDILHHKGEGDGINYYGAVRNHWYKFTVNSINSLGVPIDDPDQPIIPARYNYQGMISVYLDILDWHSMSSDFTFD